MSEKRIHGLTADNLDTAPFVDNAFAISNLATQDAAQGHTVINATIGSLCDEDGRLVALKTVYDLYDQVDSRQKAAYAAGIGGNPSFCQDVYAWINRKEQLKLPHVVIGTPGGTGAISLAISATLTAGQTLLIPDPAWSSYRIMAKQKQLVVQSYPLVDKNGQPALPRLKDIAAEIMAEQHKLVIIINDPCQNPTGLTLGRAVWAELMAFFKQLSAAGPVVIINDIAYLDYSPDLDEAVDYMNCFNDLGPAMAVIIAFSCSKSLTAYGMRLGAAVIMAESQDTVDQFESVALNYCRADWSNVNNGMMTCFSQLYRHHMTEYRQEKDTYIKLLQKRAAAFIKAAAACQLPLFPYSGGFFITVKMADAALAGRMQRRLMERHVYVLNFKLGLRVAICSLSVEQCSQIVPLLKQALADDKNDQQR